MLSLASDYTGKTAPDFMVMPFGWPRPLWILLMGHQPSDADVAVGLIFMAVCNIVLYGSVVYGALLMLSMLKTKRVNHGVPPPPERFLDNREKQVSEENPLQSARD